MDKVECVWYSKCSLQLMYTIRLLSCRAGGLNSIKSHFHPSPLNHHSPHIAFQRVKREASIIRHLWWAYQRQFNQFV